MESTLKENQDSRLNTTGTNHQNHKKNGSGSILQNSSNNPTSSRSKLSTASFIKWLRCRFQSSLPKRYPYLYFPHQLTRQTSIQQIFVQFDADGSGGLSRDEVFDMFNGFGINITMDHLNELYDSVEVNLQQLDCQMFKKCALAQKSNKVFRQIVRQLQVGCTQEQRQYLPHNFTNMIIYLVYLSKREQLKQNIQKDRISIQDKVQSIQTLLKLKDLSLNNQKLSLHSEKMKRNLKNKFRDIWEKVNQKHGQKFPFTSKMEEQFCYYYMNRKENKQGSKPILKSKTSFDKSFLKTRKKL